MSEGSAPPFHSTSDVDPLGAVVVEPAPDPLLPGVGEVRRVVVAGGTGFVGRHLVPRLLSRGHEVRVLARTPPASDPSELDWRRVDITDRASLEGSLAGYETLLHLVGIPEERGDRTFRRVHVEGTRNLLAEAVRAGIRRVVYVSAAGARSEGSPFFRSKYAAEVEVRESGLESVVFRPCIIYGPGDRFTTNLAALLRRLPVFPVLGAGSLRLQPVSIEDATDALAQAVERSDVAGGVFELAGPERLEFTTIVRAVARTINVRRPILRLPRALAAPALWALTRLGLPAPPTPQQLETLREGSLLTRRENALRTVFRVEPLPFLEAVADYL